MATSWVILGATCCQLRIYCIQIAPLSKSPFSPQDSSTEWPSSWGMDNSTWGQGWAEYLAPSINLGGPKAPNFSRRKKLAPSRIIVFIKENSKFQEKACPSMTPSTPPIMRHLGAYSWHVFEHLERHHHSSWATLTHHVPSCGPSLACFGPSWAPASLTSNARGIGF